MHSGRFADGKSRVCIEFGDGVGPQCAGSSGGRGWLKRYYDVRVGGMVGLLVEGSMEEAVGDGGLAGSSELASPEAAKLGSLYCVAGHGELK